MTNLFPFPFSQTRKNTARYAGLLYLLMAITAAFSLLQIPANVLVKGNAAATLHNVLAQESLVRWVMVSHFAAHTFFLLLAMALFRLLRGVHEHSAWLMVLFVVAQVPLVFVGEAFSFAALMVAKGELLQSLHTSQNLALNAGMQADMVALLLKLRAYCLLVAQVFWGLWLIPLGRLVFSSGFIPRVLGLMLMAGGVAYLLQTSIYLLLPDTYKMFSSIISPVHTIAEIATILWLLIMGTTDKASHS